LHHLDHRDQSGRGLRRFLEVNPFTLRPGANTMINDPLHPSEIDHTVDRLQNAAIELTGLCEVLCSRLQETIGMGDFRKAQSLSWSYDCLAVLAEKLARELSDAAP
jgi:hypothetical protein